MLHLLIGLVALCLPADELSDQAAALRSDDDRARRSAVQALARIASDDAWELVLGALADPSAQVADEAQLLLGGRSEERVLDGLQGKEGIGSRKGNTALRAMEALGRSAVPVDVRTFVPGLRGREIELARSAAWSVERLARGAGFEGTPDKELVPALERVRERGKDGGLRAAALMALCALEPQRAAERARAAAGEGEPELRAAAALALAAVEPVPSDLLRGLLDDGVASVRAVSRRALATRPSRAVAQAFAARLAHEEELRISWSLVEDLRRWSGLRTGRNPEAWGAWAAALAQDWVPEAGQRVEASEEERSVSFAGLPILSERVAFLVDFSGSLWEERAGTTRKEVALRELRGALEALARTARFAVIPYTETPHPWRDGLTEASPKNVAAAIQAFEKCKERGKGAVWEAALLALEDPDVDTIAVFTDGAPTGGARWHLGLMAELLEERTRFRGVVIEAVLVEASGGLQARWRELCGRTGGRVVPFGD